MSNYIEIPALIDRPDSTPVLINLDNIITIKRYDPDGNESLLSFRYGEDKTVLIEFDNNQIRDEYYEKIRRLLINEL